MAALEPLGDRGRGERPQPRGGQFDRQRQAVDAATDLGDGLALGRVGDPVGERRASALHEQLLGGGGVERAHGHDRLAGDAERPAARHEHAHIAARGREVADHGPEVGDQMLGPVEHHEQPGGAEPLPEDAEGVAVTLAARADATDAERVADRGEDLAGGAQRSELHEPGAVGRAVQQRAGRLGGERGLADARRADQRHDPVRAQGRGERRELALASDDARHPGAHVGGMLRPAGGPELVRVPEHLRLELTDLRAGLQADLGQPGRERPVLVERLGVAARRVAGGHQLEDQLLAQGVLGHEHGQLGARLAGAAERHERGGTGPAEAVADRVQPARLDRRGVVDDLEVRERLAAPQPKRLVAEGQRRGRRQAGRVVGEAGEAVRVDRLGRDAEPVSRGLAHEDPAGGAGRAFGIEDGAELGEPHVQGAGDAVTAIGRPRRLDQRLRGDRRARADQQPREQGAFLRATWCAPVHQHGPEDGELHATTVPVLTPGNSAASRTPVVKLARRRAYELTSAQRVIDASAPMSTTARSSSWPPQSIVSAAPSRASMRSLPSPPESVSGPVPPVI